MSTLRNVQRDGLKIRTRGTVDSKFRGKNIYNVDESEVPVVEVYIDILLPFETDEIESQGTICSYLVKTIEPEMGKSEYYEIDSYPMMLLR